MTSRREILAWVAATNLVSLCAVALLLIARPGTSGSDRFVELTAERLNIVGAEGRPVLILSNRRLMPGPSLNGKQYSRELSEGRELLSGMLFFNEDGDEVGGLLFNGFRKGSGPQEYGALGHLSFDQWKQNQVIALQYNDHGTDRRAGLMVWDRPTSPTLDVQLDRAERLRSAQPDERAALLEEQRAAAARGDNGAQRVFVGSQDRVAKVELMDPSGRTRLRLRVDGGDGARLEFLDAEGRVTSTYPPLR